MIILQKNPDKDFIILNLTDTQLSNEEWADGHKNRQILEYTITQLIEKNHPDLITISGDLAWAGNDYAYKMLGEFLEKFHTPWAIVWGNHDNQNGAECIEKNVNTYFSYPHFIYEKGNPELGNGNYLIGIEENGKPVTAFIMMDSHDKDDYIDKDGNPTKVWAKLIPPQMDWYREQTQTLKNKGYTDATLLLHIPIYAYQTASRAAYKNSISQKELTWAQSEGSECWNEGYTDSIGVQHEEISSYPEEDGVFEIIKKEGVTKRILAGHDHVNNFMIYYEGIHFIYALKTGAGCYWDSCINGGTILKANSNGIYQIKHDYVDISHLL